MKMLDAANNNVVLTMTDISFLYLPTESII